MELLKNVSTQQKKIVVSQKLVDIGDSTWQIKNLTGVSSHESKVVLNVPEPTFSDTRPEGEFQLSPLIIAGILGATVAAYNHNAVWLWIGIGIGVFNIWDGKSSEKQEWQRKYDKYCHQHRIWREIKNNPPTVFSLEFETNSGSRPAFYSFSKYDIEKAVKAIRESMINPSESQTTYNISTIDLSGDTNINNVGSTIYEQNIREYR